MRSEEEETPRYQPTRIFQLEDSDHYNTANTGGSSYVSFGPSPDRRMTSEQSSSYNTPNNGPAKHNDLLVNLKKSYLKRDFTPDSKPQRDKQMLVVSDNRNTEKDLIESPKVPVFRSITDNSSTLNYNRSSQFSISPNYQTKMPRDREDQKIRTIQSLLPKIAIVPTAIDSQLDDRSLQKRSSRDHYLSQGGQYHPQPFELETDSFARKISFHNMQVQPSPFLDGGRTLLKTEETFYIYNRAKRPPFYLRVDKVDVSNDSWSNSHFALVDPTDQSAVFNPKSAYADNRFFKRSSLSIPHADYIVTALEISTSGDSLYVTSDHGCHAFNLFSGRQLYHQRGKP